MTTDQKEYVASHMGELKELLLTLCRIPAPSGQEERRAEFCRDWLRKAGAEHVDIDDALNVRCLIPGKPQSAVNDQASPRRAGLGSGAVDNIRSGGEPGKGLPLVVFMAHTDTVFPDLEPMEPVERDGKLYCPGVGDDTANLAVLLMCAKYLIERKAVPMGYDMLLVANSGEEGLGNLKGSRRIVEEFGDRIAWFYSLDGTAEGFTNRAVGSRRYLVEVRTEGGHSYGNFGNRNAIALLAGMIGSLYELKVPDRGKTTYNVGLVSGGTSVNTIAQQAEMLYEYRSDDLCDMEFMERHFQAVVEGYRAKGVEVKVELIGERPCNGKVDPDSQVAMASLVSHVLGREFLSVWADRLGKDEWVGSAGSTDCNIPLSLGIPALCFGCYLGAGAHTREEWIELSSLEPGFRAGLSVMLAYV